MIHTDSNEKADEEEVTTGPRRSAREKKPRQYFPIERCNLAVHSEVTIYKEAVDSPYSKKWKEAIKVEMRSLQDHQVWDLVKLPPGMKTVRSKWVFKVKTNQERELERFKATRRSIYEMEDCKPVSTPVS